MYNKPAITAPTIGARMNTQTCSRACPPMNNAGAKLRAGLTEVPVNGIPIICTNAKVKPITMPAIVAFSVFLVTPSTVNTNTKVKNNLQIIVAIFICICYNITINCL